MLSLNASYDKTKEGRIQSIQLKHNNTNTYSKVFGLNAARFKAEELCRESLASLKHIAKLGYNTSTLSAFSRYIMKRSD